MMKNIPVQDASDLEQLKAQFLANISHEMRTPINGIIGSVKLLQMMNQDVEQEELLDGIEVSGRRLMHLVENVLLHVELSSGRIEGLQERLMPGRLLTDLVDSFRRGKPESQVALCVEVDGSVPDWALADKENLIRILNQFVDNALKHTHRGSVTLRIRMTDEAPFDGCDWANRVMAVSVMDTGIGIEPDVLAGLFASFSKADNTYTSRYQGAGLGLMLCRLLAHLMHGRLEVESESGKGSVFTLVFPVQVEDDSGENALKRRTPRILVVEDDETSRTLMGLFCELVEMEPVLAQDGITGWEWYQRLDFDLILMDIQMPGMSGLEVLERIRRQEKVLGKHTCVIAVTAYAMSEDRSRFLSAGFDDVLEKPVDLNRFRNLLAKWHISEVPVNARKMERREAADENRNPV